MKKGFTLVELSIVLVIIGLLTGGILVGQSLIESAQMSKTVRMIGQFDSALILFKDKYKSLPGDSKFFGGDGNGAITRVPHTAPSRRDNNVFQHEIANFWGGLLPDQYENIPQGSTAIPVPKLNAPEVPMGIKNTVFVVGATGTGGFVADLSNIRNFYVMMSPDNFRSDKVFSNGSNNERAFKPMQLLALDSKIDDSLASSGFVSGGSIPRTGIFTGEISSCSGGFDYKVDNESYNCMPMILIGGTTFGKAIK